MMKNIKTSRELYRAGAFSMFKHAVTVTLIVVTIAAFIRGSDFEFMNIVKALAFIITSWGVVSYIVMYFIVRKSIQLGEAQDNGILFRKE